MPMEMGLTLLVVGGSDDGEVVVGIFQPEVEFAQDRPQRRRKIAQLLVGQFAERRLMNFWQDVDFKGTARCVGDEGNEVGVVHDNPLARFQLVGEDVAIDTAPHRIVVAFGFVKLPTNGHGHERRGDNLGVGMHQRSARPLTVVAKNQHQFVGGVLIEGLIACPIRPHDICHLFTVISASVLLCSGVSMTTSC